MPMLSEGAGPLAGQRNLPDRRRSLAVFELEPSFGQGRDRTTERNRAGGYHNHARAALVEGGNIRDERFEPCALDSAEGAVDQER